MEEYWKVVYRVSTKSKTQPRQVVKNATTSAFGGIRTHDLL